MESAPLLEHIDENELLKLPAACSSSVLSPERSKLQLQITLSSSNHWAWR